MEQIIDFLTKFYPISNEAITAFCEKLEKHQVKKGEIIAKENEVENHLYFVSNGCLRSYYIKDSKDITISFTLENDFVTSMYSFISRKPSYEFIEALEDSIYYTISYDDLQSLFKEFKEVETLYRKVLQQYYIMMEERIIFSKFKTAKQRYQHLMETRPEIIQKASVGHVASYLDVSIETLSRIRSRN